MLFVLKLIIDVASKAAAGPQRADFSARGLACSSLPPLLPDGGYSSSPGRFCGRGADQVVSDHVMRLLIAKSIEVELTYYESPSYHTHSIVLSKRRPSGCSAHHG